MAGLTIRQTAQALGLRYGEYLALEEGREPLAPHAHAIAALYDIPIESLCHGPLPVPKSYAPPLNAPDDISLMVSDWNELTTALWRYRQAYDEPWSRFVRRLAVPPVAPFPLPYPVLRISSIPVVLWLDLPYEAKASWEVVASAGQKTYLIGPHRTICLPPGRYTLQCKGSIARCYFFPATMC